MKRKTCIMRGSTSRPMLSIVLILLLCSFCSNAQTVKGWVTSKGQPVIGASVKIKGVVTTAATDSSGSFSIEATAESVLEISHVSYLKKEVPVNGQTSITIELEPMAANLDEVVVVGYGTQKKVTLTGAVADVKGSELAKTPTLNLTNSLAGRLPGITALNGSGEPGYDGSTVRIRGTNSIGNSSALIVIDGVPDREGGMERLNPNDIESMSVLKDASAAIYGSRAANGVILITTKRGKSGKPALSYTFNQGWAQPTVIPELADAVEYGTIRNELAVYENSLPLISGRLLTMR